MEFKSLKKISLLKQEQGMFLLALLNSNESKGVSEFERELEGNIFSTLTFTLYIEKINKA